MTTARRGFLGRRRTTLGYAVALGLPVVATAVLTQLRTQLTLSSDVLVFLVLTVLASLVGGFGPAVASAVVGTMLLNWFFTPPLHALSVSDTDDAVTLVVFVAVALLVSSAVEIAARRSNEAARAAADADALIRVDRTRTALLAAVGHDLRTPLAAAKASLSTLRSPDLELGPADRAELMSVAEESLDRLTALIENLLDMSRLQAGALAVTLRPVELEEVVARALDDLGAVEVTVEVPRSAPPALADPGLLERVLVNLLANALHHSPQGSPPVLTLDVGERHLELRVVDRGPGIPEDQRDQVFLPFQRLGDTDNTTGVGLGLALSRGLTGAMGGTLEAEETPGGGLTMVVRLRPGDEAQDVPRPGLRERAQGGVG